MSNFIITITGDLGSGKSTVSKMLAQSLNVCHFSTGAALRNVAATRGLSILELNHLAEKDPSIDKELDAVFVGLKHSTESLVIDSRMAWFFLPDSLKIKLTVDPVIAAQRIHADTKRISEQNFSITETLESIQKRRDSEHKRYRLYYGVDSEARSNFDYVIDTTMLTPDQVVKQLRGLVAASMPDRPIAGQPENPNNRAQP